MLVGLSTAVTWFLLRDSPKKLFVERQPVVRDGGGFVLPACIVVSRNMTFLRD